jgi:hypothetical protein
MVTRRRAAGAVPDSRLVPELVERVLAEFVLRERPSLDLAGLKSLFAADGTITRTEIAEVLPPDVSGASHPP